MSSAASLVAAEVRLREKRIHFWDQLPADCIQPVQGLTVPGWVKSRYHNSSSVIWRYSRARGGTLQVAGGERLQKPRVHLWQDLSAWLRSVLPIVRCALLLHRDSSSVRPMAFTSPCQCTPPSTFIEQLYLLVKVWTCADGNQTTFHFSVAAILKNEATNVRWTCFIT